MSIKPLMENQMFIQEELVTINNTMGSLAQDVEAHCSDAASQQELNTPNRRLQNLTGNNTLAVSTNPPEEELPKEEDHFQGSFQHASEGESAGNDNTETHEPPTEAEPKVAPEFLANSATWDPDIMYLHEAMKAPDKDKFVEAINQESNEPYKGNPSNTSKAAEKSNSNSNKSTTTKSGHSINNQSNDNVSNDMSNKKNSAASVSANIGNNNNNSDKSVAVTPCLIGNNNHQPTTHDSIIKQSAVTPCLIGNINNSGL